MRENKFRPLAIVLLTLVFAMGLFIFLYPYFRGAVIDREIQEHAQDFQSCVKFSQLPVLSSSTPLNQPKKYSIPTFGRI